MQASLPAALRLAADRFSSLPAILTDERRVDFAEFDRASDAIAAGLAVRGVAKGERIGLYCINSVEFALAYAGIVKAGAVVVPINLLLSAEEVHYNLADAGVSGLIYHGQVSANAAAVADRLSGLKVRAGIGLDGPDGDVWRALLEESAAPPCIEFDGGEDLAVILYTSGTTGHPKGAMLTHGNLLANTTSVREALDWRPGEDRVLVVLPMFHAFAATVGMLTPLLHGCALIPLAKFEPDRVADTIGRHRASLFLGVPSMYALLCRLGEERIARFGTVRLCVSGGAALPPSVMEQFQARFGLPIHEGDGPTECSPVTCVNPVAGPVKRGTVGLPVPGVEMKILGEDGAELPRGELGEIAVRGANVFKGYWNQPEATRECFRDGWFLTGDLGQVDDDGYFSIVDRKKDLIIVNGMNVYPRVIEEVLCRHPAVREVAVVGDPDPLHGERVVAYVVLDAPASEAEIRAWCKPYLGRHEIPRQVKALQQLPRNAAGKVVKRQLRRQGEVERGVDA
ncbi:long-chain-fatty-acid--CoA ligase [Methylococcus capsulatus]|uniref:long-chain-fatty-acid--CoA ligase n=1 Tax=Methylococcus capsulatus TaxID=414 RepID=UPI001C530821|nr:long-chain fatty acid--CoA ligase [Methylococcus capsulatus]QXP87750.1 long-chain fatty acid--CoA ligase [Methylococcus capsulatus]QXP92512.1 long-chain fatty acid--CoA ligase [Methylococcus capsulatus]UQN12763.1 long-chain fatty acid--CoA ligase [Methylococcus capsulatus]